MNAAQLIATYVPAVSDEDCFRNFNVDMTRSNVIREVNGRLAMVPAMDRAAGQKQSERMLWNVTTPKAVVVDPAIARQAELDRLALVYASNPSFELEVDPMVFATGLAHAYRHHTGEAPLFLLDDNGEY